MGNTYDAVKLLGTLAVEKGWVKQLEVLQALSNQTEGTFFGEILLRKKLISETQLNELLHLQKESEIKKEDYLFGQIAVHNQFLKAHDVISSITEQKSSKLKKTLGAILVEKGLLNNQQCTAILQSQKRILKLNPTKKKKNISCPKCKTFYEITDTERFRNVRCKKCQFVFEVGSPVIKVIENVDMSNKNISSKDTSLLRFLKENHLTLQESADDKDGIFAKENEKYILGAEIARGGMGAILLTKDVNLRRNIVTKVLLNKKSNLATLRFIEEAQITGQLEHPNIPPVHDLGVNDQDNIFFTMKQIKGETLLDIIKKIKNEKEKNSEKYSYKNLIGILIKVCNALDFAHSKNVIHRDIKPENIMVGEYGEVLLMDWGLAKIIGASEEFEELETEKVSSVRSEDESSNTIAGTTAGTPAFMSPEQASGQLDKLDQRSDIYSLGATLFNVLSLEKPYKGSSVYELLNNVAIGNMQELKGNIPLELKAITMKAMALKQKDRYQTIREMEKDLISFQMGYSVSAKKDNTIELLLKFYHRNKMLSIVTVAFLLVFLISSTLFIASLQAQRNKAQEALIKAELAIKQFEKEKADRIIDNQNSAPTYFVKAKNEAQVDRFNEAIKLMDTAITYDSANQNYHLYRGCLFLAENNIKNAIADLSLIQNSPQQQHIDKMLKFLKMPGLGILTENDKAILAEICTELKILDVAQKLTSTLSKKMELWNKQLKNAWPKEIYTLTFVNNMVTFRLDNSKENIDLSPLKGIPIQSLTICFCQNLSNISALEGLPIEYLYINSCPLISDISALKNTKLKSIFFEKIKVTDLSPLANSELTSLTLRTVPITTLKPLFNLPIKVIDLFDINLTKKEELKSFSLESLSLFYNNIDSFDLINLKNLKILRISNRMIKDISLLKDSPLEILEISGCPVSDITPIKNKNIKYLNILGCRINNIEVLLTLKNLETIIARPDALPLGWESIIIKMKDQIKGIGIGPGDYLRSVDIFIKESHENIKNK
jgi:serine/threonine protein kinase